METLRPGRTGERERGREAGKNQKEPLLLYFLVVLVSRGFLRTPSLLMQNQGRGVVCAKLPKLLNNRAPCFLRNVVKNGLPNSKRAKQSENQPLEMLHEHAFIVEFVPLPPFLCSIA